MRKPHYIPPTFMLSLYMLFPSQRRTTAEPIHHPSCYGLWIMRPAHSWWTALDVVGGGRAVGFSQNLQLRSVPGSPFCMPNRGRHAQRATLFGLEARGRGLFLSWDLVSWQGGRGTSPRLAWFCNRFPPANFHLPHALTPSAKDTLARPP